VRLGLFTDGLMHLPFETVVAWCSERGIHDLELGVGGYSPGPHLDLAALLSREDARASLLAVVESRGCRIAALNASGNPLHPDPGTALPHDRALRGAVELAALLGVDRVVAMSGCPGGPGGDGRWPVFAGGAWLPDMEGLWQWQWQRIASYWRGLTEWASTVAPTVTICLELHPGTSIYNPASFELLRRETNGTVAVNLDPSHFWWQGIEPLEVVSALGEAIGYVHGKDTLIRASQVAQNGVFDYAWPERRPDELPWHFAAVGSGHEIDTWRVLLDRVAATGYDGVVAIEHEDPRLAPEEGIEASLRALQEALEAGAG
jgi:sugar phosphate isomerase/epimerase